MVVDGVDVAALIGEEVLAEYRERGYWRSPRLFDRDTTARLRRAHERLWAGDFDHRIPSQYGSPRDEPDATAVRQQCNAFWLNDDIRAVTTSPLLGAIGARLMGVDEARLWHDQAVIKPGVGAGGAAVTAGNIGWHQDYGHWQCSSSTNMCTAWIALQDTDLGNGAMRTIVGSHRWGLLEDSANFGNKDLEGLKARLSTQEISGAWIDEPCLLREGEVSFHHCLTLHGSGPNLSKSARLCLISHMMPGDTSYRLSRQYHPNMLFLGPDA
ncbi:MAG: phytanoyl-CoA dioxygenase family protein, partial [Spirochaetaceae bacterium]|nr:phytanoyl-CoA dioxygenase family protein [Spirochaetaceae bacterium]